MESPRYKAFLPPVALGYGVFAVLLGFSVLFYLERACYADIAFQTFGIINSQTVFYQLDRFGAAFIQVFPLAAVLLKLPLKYVLVTYSVALVLQNLFFYWVLHKFLKQPGWALVLLLFNVLLVSETFYWATNEIKQGLSFSILFGGVVSALPVERFTGLRKYGLLLLYLVLLLTTIFLHPLVVFPVVFVLGFLALSKRKSPNPAILWSAAIVALIMGAKYLVLPVSYYDEEQLEHRQNFITYFPNYFAVDSFESFFRWCIKDWYIYGILMVLTVGFYAYRRQWFKLGWLLLFTVGYLIIVNVTHLNTPKPFLESYYQALSVFVLLPFVFDLLPKTKAQYALGLLVLIVILRINTIYHHHHHYTSHITAVRRTLELFPGKFVVPADRFPQYTNIMTWGVPNTSALLSSMESPDSCRSFFVTENVAGAMLDDATYAFKTPFRPFSYNTFNPHYFRPAPGAYRVLTDEELTKLQEIKKP